jgi:hypothetical protein
MPKQTTRAHTGPDRQNLYNTELKRREVGKNSAGQMLFEDERGVRSRLEGSIRITEPVEMRPTREGIQLSVDHTNRPEWKTTEELAAEKLSETEAAKSEGPPQNRGA